MCRLICCFPHWKKCNKEINAWVKSKNDIFRLKWDKNSDSLMKRLVLLGLVAVEETFFCSSSSTDINQLICMMFASHLHKERPFEFILCSSPCLSIDSTHPAFTCSRIQDLFGLNTWNPTGETLSLSRRRADWKRGESRQPETSSSQPCYHVTEGSWSILTLNLNLSFWCLPAQKQQVKEFEVLLSVSQKSSFFCLANKTKLLQVQSFIRLDFLF